MPTQRNIAGVLLLLSFSWSTESLAAQPHLRSLEAAHSREIQPLLKKFCYECHSGELTEAELDLAALASFSEVRKHPKAWQRIGEMLDQEQMPPRGAPQLSAKEQDTLQNWVRSFLTVEGAAKAGDPGPVVLRRLNNAEYTYTIRDLTGIAALEPAKEFPVDSGAGEGFTNVGNALVMSPSLFTKYLDSAKELASHAVLLPHGIRFSPSTTRRDWTNESLARIRDFYARYATTEQTDRKGKPPSSPFDANFGGRLPIEAYLTATLEEREALQTGRKTITDVAGERNLNSKYLGILWETLNQRNDSQEFLIDVLRTRWQSASPAEADQLANFVANWQKRLWKFNLVGQIGRIGQPTSWMETVDPVVPRLDIRAKLHPKRGDQDVVFYLKANDAGDGAQNDIATWEQPRFVAPGRPDLMLRDAGSVAQHFVARRSALITQAASCLRAAAEASTAPGKTDMVALAEKHQVDAKLLRGWLNYLGISSGEPKLGLLLPRQLENIAKSDFVKGWAGDGSLMVVANTSDEPVRVPGHLKPHCIAVHPAAHACVVVGWQSPIAGHVRISGTLQAAQVECGNGVSWSLQLCRGNMRLILAEGMLRGSRVVSLGPLERIPVQPGDTISLVVNSHKGHEPCDMTIVHLTLNDDVREWNLANDVSADILAGNPHADTHGNNNVWHFYDLPNDAMGPQIPRGSLMAKWILADRMEQSDLGNEIQTLLNGGMASLAKHSPDLALYLQLNSLSGPLSPTTNSVSLSVRGDASSQQSPYGLPSELFGQRPDGSKIDTNSLAVQAPSLLEVRLPAALVEGAEFISGSSVQPGGSVQLDVHALKPENANQESDAKIVVAEDSPLRKSMQAAIEKFRQLFPPALCYAKIVPVDEAITLSLYFREDQHLRRLMLTGAESALLDRHWDELLFIAQEPVESVGAFEQLLEYATQDRPDLVRELTPLRQSVQDRAALFRQRLRDCESSQLEAIIAFAARAYRRPLQDEESQGLRKFYTGLRQQELSHEEAVRLTLARVLVSPAFLYRSEKPSPGTKVSPVSDWELASRLSYFLWSSLPDEELRGLAAEGKLQEPSNLTAQARRMMRDPKSRRLATEFGCQWLHIQDFDQLNEKSERHFPTFSALRGAMHEESILFFVDLIQNDRSVLNLLDADYTFLNEDLARHYGIPNVSGPVWQRVDGVRQYGRGGILSQATILAKQSGASRTSPILRGNWVSEVLLGERLPRPPKDVPQLADSVPEGLTERQLFERHSEDPACMKCHARIDPFGFALENYDAIGRVRQTSGEGLAIDAKSTLPDGAEIDGINGLRSYLKTARRAAFLRQFNKKLLGYALGRSVMLSDEPLLTEMQAALTANDFRISSVVDLIVQSPQFRNIRGADIVEE